MKILDKNLFHNISKVKILVIGDIILDKYIFGNSNRLSPEFPVPVVNIIDNKASLGGSTNVAENLATIGAKVSLCGIIGDDNDGIEVLDLLKKSNIDSQFIIRKKKTNTTVKTRLISNKFHLARIDNDIDKISFTKQELAKLLKVISNFDLIIISDYNKGLINKNLVNKVVEKAKENSIKIYVDPKQNASVYQNVDYITPNEKEFKELFLKDLTGSLIKYSSNLINDFKIQNIIITKGDRGYTFISANKKAVHGLANKVDVYDICGAGDTFISYFSLFNFLFKNEIESLRIASLVATFTVTKPGIYSPSKTDLIQILSLNE